MIRPKLKEWVPLPGDRVRTIGHQKLRSYGVAQQFIPPDGWTGTVLGNAVSMGGRHVCAYVVWDRGGPPSWQGFWYSGFLRKVRGRSPIF